MGFHEKKQIMDEAAIEETLDRISHEIVKKCEAIEELVIIGIRNRGEYLAERIAKKIEEISGAKVPLGILDITLYRDDLTLIADQPVVRSTEIPFDLTGKRVILVDDVLYTGRTMRAAIDEIIDFGRPRFVQIAVLIDRGQRELPIAAEYVGKNVETSKDELVEVQVKQVDDKEQVIVVAKVEK